MAYFDELMQRAITVRNNVAPSSNTALLVGGVLVSIVSALQLLLDTKQGTLTFDDEPTDGSTNPVTSDGIYEAIADALASIDLSACEKIVNKVTALSAQSTDVQYPSAKCVYDALQAIDLSACEKIVNKVTSLSAQSTDIQYPSAKLLYDSLQALANVYAPKVHTHQFADIEHPAVVATVGAQGYTITTVNYSFVLTVTDNVTVHLPAMQSGAAIELRVTIIQDATGGRAVTFDGGAALVYNPYQTDLSLGQARYRCWVLLCFDGVNWAWFASPYVLRAESQFAYYITGTTGGSSVTVTINGTTMQIQANSGVWEYGYNNAITSLSFANDTDLETVDFSLSDGLAGVTSLDSAFSGCTSLTTVDLTACDLSNVASATNAFSGCSALTSLVLPSDSWQPDLDLSATAIAYANMSAVIAGLYTYGSGTHTVTFNTTIWDALTAAQQQAISDAAALKGWTTNAVAVQYYIRGKSTAASESFSVQFSGDNAPVTITVPVDASGYWEYAYSDKKIIRLTSAFKNNTTITEIEITEPLDQLQYFGENAQGAFQSCTSLIKASFPNGLFNKQNLTARQVFQGCTSLQEVSMPVATFENTTITYAMFNGCTALTTIDLSSAKFEGGIYGNEATFSGCSALQTLSLPNATFTGSTSVKTLFSGCTSLQSISLPKATFTDATNANDMFRNCTNLLNISMPAATFKSVTNLTGTFRQCTYLQTLSMPLSTFEKATGATYMFYGTPRLTTIDWTSATMEKLAATDHFMQDLSALTTLTLTQQSTAIDITSTASSAPLNLQGSPLTYQSMLNVANWISDLTGYSAHTVTFKTAAWNALSAAEQATITGIVTSKNWNLATA